MLRWVLEGGRSGSNAPAGVTSGTGAWGCFTAGVVGGGVLFVSYFFIYLFYGATAVGGLLVAILLSITQIFSFIFF